MIYTYHFFLGEYDYQYQLGQNAAQDPTPRGAAISENVAILPTTHPSNSREYPDNQDHDYQRHPQMSNEVFDLSGEFEATPLNDEQRPSTESVSHIGYQSNEGKQGQFPSRGKNLVLGSYRLIPNLL